MFEEQQTPHTACCYSVLQLHRFLSTEQNENEIKMSRVLKLIGSAALILMPAEAQFGVANKRKKGSSFEDLNELAKQNQGGDADDLADMMAGLGDYDLESLMAGLGDLDMDSLVEMMNSPEYQKEYKKYLAELGLDDDDTMAKVGDAMKMLQDPVKLADAMTGVLGSLQSEEFVDAIVGQKDAVLDQLTSSGLLTPEQIEQYRNDPNKFGEDMKESFSKMQELFTDPDMMRKIQESIDPTKLTQMMDAYKDFDLASLFTDEEKSEETRLALLDPRNPLSAMFAESKEMREILHDPVKWKAALKEGLDVLTTAPGGADVPKKKGRAVLAGDEL